MSSRTPETPIHRFAHSLVDRLLALGEMFYRIGLWGVQASYRSGLRKVHRLPVKVVSVGNLTWGGTGKTPLVIQLAKGLKAKGYSPAVLTRGYGWDEAKLLADRLSPIPVVVGPDRVASGRRAARDLGADLLLLDDGYQQWRLKKDLEILTVDAGAPFGNGHLIPRGSLREPIPCAARADLIVVTRADLNPGEVKDLKERIRKVSPKAPIFLARYQPTRITKWPSGQELPWSRLQGEPICTLAGIADPKQFETTVERLGAEIGLKIRVQDHHPYSIHEMVRIFARCQQHRIRRIVTTAKDAVRIPGGVGERLGDGLRSGVAGLGAGVAGPEAGVAGLREVELLVLDVSLAFEPDESELLHRIDSVLAG